MDSAEQRYQRQSANYQVQLAAVETFASILTVYRGLGPELGIAADNAVATVMDNETTPDERMLTLHTLMELFFGGPAVSICDCDWVGGSCPKCE